MTTELDRAAALTAQAIEAIRRHYKTAGVTIETTRARNQLTHALRNLDRARSQRR